jgi:hypothetical protein
MIGYGFTYKMEIGFGANQAAGPQIDPAFGRLAAFGVSATIYVLRFCFNLHSSSRAILQVHFVIGKHAISGVELNGSKT